MQKSESSKIGFNTKYVHDEEQTLCTVNALKNHKHGNNFYSISEIFGTLQENLLSGKTAKSITNSTGVVGSLKFLQFVCPFNQP